ncbi:uncharacterized protein LOC127733559 [Mytilus californianus]|uniref:uncharacterized protein LOC127733559 n=1 Tax=Mytilus californianus TaxID=6549 RepID=UPI002245E2E5|nr:uncharacterized protein LOC127733559 [Mytilus californianus]
MPTVRERSCSEKEVQAIRFNYNEQQCLEKKINGLKQEGACSIHLINQTHKNIKVSYKSLKDKVSKIKSHLNVKEIEEFRRLENNGKIEIFKSISKPDSASRISTYAKRLQIEYDENQSASAAKHSDDLIHNNPFSDDDMTRKDLLLRQISDLNDRFNAVREKERALENGLVPNNTTIISVKTNKKRNKSNSDNETDQSDIQQRTNVSQSETSSKYKGCRKESMLRPSTAFDFSSNKPVHDIIRPATSLGNCKSEVFENKKNKSSAIIKRSKSVKVAPSKESAYTQEFKTVKEIKGVKSKSVRRTKSLKKATSLDSSKEKDIVTELDMPHLADKSFSSEPTFKTEKNPIENVISEGAVEKHVLTNVDEYSNIMPEEQTNIKTSKGKGQTRISSSFKHGNSATEHHVSIYNNPDSQGSNKAKLKRHHTVKVRPTTAVSTGSDNNSVQNMIFKKGSKVRPSTAVSNCTENSTPRSAALSALSGRSEAVANIIACMNGPQHAPFDCHAAAERVEKEINTKTILEEGRTKFLSRDSVESNLGHDLHQELRKELIQEEEKEAIKIEDKICSFMDRLNDKLKSENKSKEAWSVQTPMLTVNDSLKRQPDAPQIKRVNMRRQNKFSEEEQRKMEQNMYRRSSSAWKDVNKCRYLRIEESKIDLSGIKTLAADQFSLLNNLKYAGYEAVV